MLGRCIQLKFVSTYLERPLEHSMSTLIISVICFQVRFLLKENRVVTYQIFRKNLLLIFLFN